MSELSREEQHPGRRQEADAQRVAYERALDRLADAIVAGFDAHLAITLASVANAALRESGRG